MLLNLLIRRVIRIRQSFAKVRRRLKRLEKSR